MPPNGPPVTVPRRPTARRRPTGRASGGGACRRGCRGRRGRCAAAPRSSPAAGRAPPLAPNALRPLHRDHAPDDLLSLHGHPSFLWGIFVIRKGDRAADHTGCERISPPRFQHLCGKERGNGLSSWGREWKTRWKVWKSTPPRHFPTLWKVFRRDILFVEARCHAEGRRGSARLSGCRQISAKIDCSMWTGGHGAS